MKVFIVSVPLFNDEMTVEAYYFKFQKSDNLLLSTQSVSFLDGIANSPCFEILNMVGLEPFTGGLPIFVPINKFSLLANIQDQVNLLPEKVVLLLDDDILPQQIYIDSIVRLKLLGFKIAFKDVINNEYKYPLMPYADYVFLDTGNQNFIKFMEKLKRDYPNIEIVLENIYTHSQFKSLRDKPIKYYEGRFHSLPVTKGQTTVEPIKVNIIQLINLVNNEGFEIEKVANIVMKDISLAISLLRLVNSPHLGISNKIKSISHAIAMLGQNEIRKWIITAVTISLQSDKPNEITKLSLIRAKFTENLAESFGMSAHAQSLFLMGLFSVIDVILDLSMDEVLKAIKVSDNIWMALSEHRGDFYKVFELMLAYEKADWNTVSYLLIMNKIPVENVYNAYIDSAKWYSSIIKEFQ